MAISFKDPSPNGVPSLVGEPDREVCGLVLVFSLDQWLPLGFLQINQGIEARGSHFAGSFRDHRGLSLVILGQTDPRA